MPKLPNVPKRDFPTRLSWRSSEAAAEIAKVLSNRGTSKGNSYFRAAVSNWLKTDESAKEAFIKWYESQ